MSIHALLNWVCMRFQSIATSNFQKQLLKGVISDTALPLGETPVGKAWATKALHPSDLESPSAGCPDQKTMPSAILHFDSKFKVSPPTVVGDDTTWMVDLHLNAGDPASLGSFVRGSTSEFLEPLTRSETLGTGIQKYFLNSQIPGSGPSQTDIYYAKESFWADNVTLYRPSYYGVTVTVDAPALKDQGTVAAAQFPYSQRHYTVPCVDYTAPAKTYACREVNVFSTRFPTFEELQNMPGVYSAKAREGVYMPMKFNDKDFNWKSPDDARLVHSRCSTLNNETNGSFELTAVNYDHPYAPVPEVFIEPVAGLPTSSYYKLPCTSNVGMIALRNISNEASVFVQIRCGYEVVVRPGSTYSPHVVKPAPYDPMAINAYFGISRQMADAYPESYNSLGTILAVIGEIASSILPVISPYVKSGAEWIYNKFTGKKKEEKPKPMSEDVVAARVRQARRKIGASDRSFHRIQFGSSRPAQTRGLRITRPSRKW